MLGSREGGGRKGEFREEEGEGLGGDVRVGGAEGGEAREGDVVWDWDWEAGGRGGEGQVFDVGIGAVECGEEGGEVEFLGEEWGGGEGGVGGVAYG